MTPLNLQKGNGWEKRYLTLLVSALMCACVSLSREMELLLRPPTTAISVLKFCSCSSFCKAVRVREETGKAILQLFRKGFSQAENARVSQGSKNIESGIMKARKAFQAERTGRIECSSATGASSRARF